MQVVDRFGSLFLRAVIRRMKELGLTQTALAQRMDASRPYVAKVLKGDVNITFSTAARFAHALQMDFIPTLTPQPAAGQRALSGSLAVWIIALAVGTLNVFGDNVGEYTDVNNIVWTYTKVSDKVPKTAKLVGSSAKPCISPSTYSGVVAIPAAFANAVYTNILLDTYAFINCAKVTKFSLPATVTDVYGAFQNCIALTTISFAAPKITFNENAFVNCPNFTAFELTGDAAANYAVEGGALYNLAKTQLIRVPIGLSNVAISESVTYIGQNAFAYSKIKSIALPAALQEISVSAFTTASSLESFSIPDANLTYATRNGVLYSKDLKTLVRVPPACTNLTVLAGVTNIADNACLGCIALKTVTCPASLKRLEAYAFSGATSIKKVTFKGDLPTLHVQETLGNLTYDAIIRYPSRYAEDWKTYLNAHNYKLHEPVPHIGCVLIFGATESNLPAPFTPHLPFAPSGVRWSIPVHCPLLTLPHSEKMPHMTFKNYELRITNEEVRTPSLFHLLPLLFTFS